MKLSLYRYINSVNRIATKNVLKINNSIEHNLESLNHNFRDGIPNLVLPRFQ